jgi:hypothetical protein
MPDTSWLGNGYIAWRQQWGLNNWLEPNLPPQGMVRFTSSEGPYVTLIVTGDPDRGGGVGGWQTSERALRQDADWWKGTPKDTLSLPLLFDLRYPGSSLSIEQRMTKLYAMGRRPRGGDRPPGVTLTGDVPERDRLIVWKIDDIRLGARDFRADSPLKLRRQALSVELSSLAAVEDVDAVRMRRTRDKKNQRRQRVIHTKQGDTLRSVAVRMLGASNRWPSLREDNKNVRHVRDPDAPLRRGTRLVIK